MYSRSMGVTPYRTNVIREPSYRQTIRIPPNYSGTAIGDAPPDGVSPAHDGVPLSNAVEDQERSPAMEVDTEISPPASVSAPAQALSVSSAPESDRANPLTSLFSGKHFPFGHGLGHEELLLLGLILFLLQENNGSTEDQELSVTLLLLSALLFFG